MLSVFNQEFPKNQHALRCISFDIYFGRLEKIQFSQNFLNLKYPFQGNQSFTSYNTYKYMLNIINED